MSNKRRRGKAPQPKVFIASQERYDLPFHEYGKLSFSYEDFIRNPSNHKLVVLTGGEDINPSIYGHKTSAKCGYVNTHRDQRDIFIAMVAIRNKIPIVGICRGAQILNCMAGGHLVQHCTGHGVWHNIRTNDGRLIRVSSTHHQMMLPPKGVEIIAWAEPKRSSEYLGGVNGRLRAPEQEVDTLYIPRINALAMQYHPEYMPDTSPAFSFALELVESRLGLQPVKTKDDFVSLPKPEITEESLKAESDYYASLSQEEKSNYLHAKWEDDFIAAKVRENMSLLWSEEEAREFAQEELDEYKAYIAKAEKETAAVDASVKKEEEEVEEVEVEIEIEQQADAID